MGLIAAAPTTTTGSTLTTSEASVASATKTATTTTASSSVLSSANSVVAAMATKAENAVTSAFASAASFLTSSKTSAANALNNTFGGTSTNTNNTNAAALKTDTGDAIESTNKRGTPNSKTFSTDPLVAGMKPLNFSGATATTATGSESMTAATSTLSQRYGQEIGNSNTPLTTAINNALKNNMADGLLGDISSTVSTGTSIRSGLESTITSAEKSVGSVINGGLDEYRALTGGISEALTGYSGGMNGFFDSSLPATTGEDGSSIAGIPTSTNPSVLGTLIASIKSLGCSIEDIPYSASSAEQSFFGALLGISYQLNLTTLVNQLTNCNHFDKYASTIAQGLYYDSAGSNIQMASTLLNATGTTSIAKTTNLGQSILTNQNVTLQTDAVSVASMLTSLGYNATDLMSTGTTIDGEPVYDSSVVDATPTVTQSAVLGNDDLALVSGATEVA